MISPNTSDSERLREQPLIPHNPSVYERILEIGLCASIAIGGVYWGFDRISSSEENNHTPTKTLPAQDIQGSSREKLTEVLEDPTPKKQPTVTPVEN